MHKTHQASRLLAMILLIAMLMSIGVYATDAQVEAPAAALNAEETTLISMDSSETIVLTFPLSKAQVGAYNAADEITWTLTRNETYANAGEIHPVNGETALFPNEVQSIALENLTYTGRGAFKVASVEHELDGQNLVLTVKTQAAVSSGNNSLIHGEGGAYMDIAGSFTLTGMADNVPLAVDTIEKLLSTNSPSFAAAVSDLADGLKLRLGPLNMRMLLADKPSPWTADVIVKRGDTARRIAREHGTTLAALLRLNKILNADKVRTGYRVRVLEFPKVRLSVSPRARTAELELNGKFFKRYFATRVAAKPAAGEYQITRDSGPRTTLARLGLSFKDADREELEMFLAPGSVVAVAAE